MKVALGLSLSPLSEDFINWEWNVFFLSPAQRNNGKCRTFVKLQCETPVVTLSTRESWHKCGSVGRPLCRGLGPSTWCAFEYKPFSMRKRIQFWKVSNSPIGHDCYLSCSSCRISLGCRNPIGSAESSDCGWECMAKLSSRANEVPLCVSLLFYWPGDSSVLAITHFLSPGVISLIWNPSRWPWILN